MSLPVVTGASPGDNVGLGGTKEPFRYTPKSVYLSSDLQNPQWIVIGPGMPQKAGSQGSGQDIGGRSIVLKIAAAGITLLAAVLFQRLPLKSQMSC